MIQDLPQSSVDGKSRADKLPLDLTEMTRVTPGKEQSLWKLKRQGTKEEGAQRCWNLFYQISIPESIQDSHRVLLLGVLLVSHGKEWAKRSHRLQGHLEKQGCWGMCSYKLSDVLEGRNTKVHPQRDRVVEPTGAALYSVVVGGNKLPQKSGE